MRKRRGRRRMRRRKSRRRRRRRKRMKIRKSRRRRSATVRAVLKPADNHYTSKDAVELNRRRHVGGIKQSRSRTRTIHLFTFQNKTSL